MLLRRARPSGQPASFVAQRLPPFVDESSYAQIILRTETLTFCFSLCSLQSPSFQVLGVNYSYRRELSHLPPLHRRRQNLVACSFPLFALS